MATQPLEPGTRLANPAIAFGNFPPARAGLIASRLLNLHSRHEIAEAIGVLIDVLDAIGPDTEDTPDFMPISDGAPGDPGDVEADGTDQGDQSNIEWHQLAGATKRAGGHGGIHREDDEVDDEPEEDDDSAQCSEDEISTLQWLACGRGPGCAISDSGGCEHDGREEEEQGTVERTNLPIVTIDRNVSSLLRLIVPKD